MRQLALLFCLLGLPLAAETRQHGNLVIDLPKGWEVSGTEDGILTLRPDLPDDECEYCAIRVTPGVATGGRVDIWLGQQTANFIDPDESEPPTITQIVAPEVFNLKGRPAAMLGQTVDDQLQILFAVQLFGRMELIAFTAPAYDMEDIPPAMAVFQRDVIPMLEGAGYVSEGAMPLMPAAAPGDLAGVWWGTTTWWSMGLDGMMSMQIDHHWLTFQRDGTFYDGTPPTGTAPFDQAERLALGDMEWGVYQQDGNGLRLTYASGKVADYTADGDGFTSGDLTVHPIQLMPDGTKIDGSVSTFFYSGFTPGIGLSGGMSAATETRFNPDGTWNFASSTGASASFDQGGGFATSGGREAKGTYQVKDGLVIRTDENGATVGSAWIFKAGSDLWIGSEPLE